MGNKKKFITKKFIYVHIALNYTSSACYSFGSNGFVSTIYFQRSLLNLKKKQCAFAQGIIPLPVPLPLPVYIITNKAHVKLITQAYLKCILFVSRNCDTESTCKGCHRFFHLGKSYFKKIAIR